jgi:hypothetical protein
VSLLCPLIISFLAVPRKSKKENILRCPVIIGIFGIVFLIGILILCYFIVEEDYSILFGLVPLMGISILAILYPITWRIVVKEECFVYRNLLGIKRKYLYSDITKIVIRERGIVKLWRIYMGKKQVTVEEMLINSEYFIKKLRSEKVFKNAQIIRK